MVLYRRYSMNGPRWTACLANSHYNMHLGQWADKLTAISYSMMTIKLHTHIKPRSRCDGCVEQIKQSKCGTDKQKGKQTDKSKL